MNTGAYEILTKFYSTSRDGVAVIKDGLVTYCNSTMSSIVGRDILNESVLDVFPTEFAKRFVSPANPDGTSVSDCVDIFGKPTEVRSFKGDGMTVLSFTRLEALEQELRKSDESFKAVKATYSKLMNVMSVIDSAAEMSVKAYTAEDFSGIPMWLKIISDGILDLNNTVMDLAEILQAREGNVDKGCHLEDIESIINNVVEISARNFNVRSITLSLSFSPSRPVFSVNHKSFTNMVLRMLSHELETVDKGSSIKLHVQCDKDVLEVSVSDDCRHEPQEHIAFLEKPTMENTDSILSRYGNNLYLLRRLVMFFDGALRVENTGSGKIITISLPKNQTLPYVQQQLEDLEEDK